MSVLDLGAESQQESVTVAVNLPSRGEDVASVFAS